MNILMSNYEKYDIFFTGLNFLFAVVCFIAGLRTNKNREIINNDKEEIKKYREGIINNRNLSSLTIVLEEVKNINKRLDYIIYKEKQNDIRGINIFNEYFNETKRIFETKSNIPSKYKELEKQLSEVTSILNYHIECKTKLSESKKCYDIDRIFDSIIFKLKKYIENLNLE